MNDELTGGGNGQTPLHPDDLDGLKIDWILTQGDLDNMEADNLEAGRIWARSSARSLDHLLDDRWFMRLHHRCFGDVWSWAGTQRVRATSIGVPPVDVPRALRDALLDARAQFDASATRDDSAATIARLHHRLAAIHPFANGNGRTLRLHSELLARATRLPSPTWGAGTPDARQRYLDALRAADAGDMAALLVFIWS